MNICAERQSFDGVWLLTRRLGLYTGVFVPCEKASSWFDDSSCFLVGKYFNYCSDAGVFFDTNSFDVKEKICKSRSISNPVVVFNLDNEGKVYYGFARDHELKPSTFSLYTTLKQLMVRMF
jgi:hypothetical protein